MKYAIAALLAAHGVAHLVGFLVSWKLMNAPEMPYRTTILHGAIDLADGGIRLYGVIWLMLALGFAASAAAVIAGLEIWRRLAIGLAAVSLVMCSLGWPDTRIGLVVNLAMLAAGLLRLAPYRA